MLRPTWIRHAGAGRLGATGERLAVAHLERARPRLLERNFRTRYGELDVVGATSAASSSARSRRASRAAAAARPSRSTRSDPRKRRRLRLMAREWLRRRRATAAAPRPAPLRRHRRRPRPPAAARRPRPCRGRLLVRAASPARAACTRSRRTTGGAAARCRSRDRGAVLGRRVADVRLEVPARDGARRRGACSGRG